MVWLNPFELGCVGPRTMTSACKNTRLTLQFKRRADVAPVSAALEETAAVSQPMQPRTPASSHRAKYYDVDPAVCRALCLSL